MKWTRFLDVLVAGLLVLGGLNWGLIGLFRVDLVAAICGGLEFGETNVLSRLIYGVVGAAAAYSVYQVVSLKGLEQHWRLRRREGSAATSPPRGGVGNETQA